jgi:hypothetical protein
MHLFWEITFTVLAIVIAGVMLQHAFRTPNPITCCVFALTAWLPVWIFTHVLWHKFISPVYYGYGWWFWVLLVIGVVMALVALWLGNHLLRAVLVIGVLLVILAFLEMIAPWHWDWDEVHFHWWWIWLIVGVVLLGVAVLVFWLVSEIAAVAVAAVAVIALAMSLVFYGVNLMHPSSDEASHKVTVKTPPASNPTPVSNTTPAPTPTAPPIPRHVKVDITTQALQQAGHKPHDLKFDHVGANTARPGSSIFSKQLNTPKEVTDFLKSGTPQAKAVLQSATQQTGATKAELEDPNNWISVQFKKAIDWGGNTYWAGGGVKHASKAKTDGAGSIAVVFIPPEQVEKGEVTSIFVVRGACTNPQTKVPTPHKPTPVPHHPGKGGGTPPSHHSTTPPPPPSHHVTPPPPPKTCYSVYGPGYSGSYPNCHKSSVDSHGNTVVPAPPHNAPGPNPAPVPVPTTGPNGEPTTQPTTSQCYDPNTGVPVSPDTPGAWCS